MDIIQINTYVDKQNNKRRHRGVLYNFEKQRNYIFMRFFEETKETIRFAFVGDGGGYCRQVLAVIGLIFTYELFLE